MRSGARLRFLQTGATHEVEEVGIRTPALVEVDELGPGRGRLPHCGHQRTSAKRASVRPSRGLTSGVRAARGLPEPQADGCSAASTRSTATSSRICGDALEKLKLNDSSGDLRTRDERGAGFRLSLAVPRLLHMEIVRERLEREFGLS